MQELNVISYNTQNIPEKQLPGKNNAIDNNLSGGEDNSTSQEIVKQAVALSSFPWDDP